MHLTRNRSDALFSVAQICTVERAAQARLLPHVLMQRASEAAAQAALRLLSAPGGQFLCKDAPVLVATGPGNNGGDAFECAAHLARHGCAVTILAPVSADDPNADYAQAEALAHACSIVFADIQTLHRLGRRRWALVVDGLFGIGLTRPLGGIWRMMVETINAIDTLRLALDVPSGLNADTGNIACSPDGARICVNATHTITFIGDKPGLHTCDGRDHAGIVSVAGLDIEDGLYPVPHAWLNRPAYFDAPSHRRRQNSHKGHYGDVQVIGGSAGMAGAAMLAAQAALKAGCGRVLIGFADPAQVLPSIAGYPELMCRSAAALDFSGATLVVGPGLGTSPAAHALVERACGAASPLVLDADGLNLVSASPSLQQLLAARVTRFAATVLTPHPLEAARLLGVHVARVQADRVQAAAALVSRFGATVILKGSGTVIAHGEALAINPTGNPALATGGTGDVLAGLCGALIAQGWSAHDAARAAVWIHGAAADRLVAAGLGPVGITASEIIDASRLILNCLIAGRPDLDPNSAVLQ